jgi:hypothetical protein
MLTWHGIHYTFGYPRFITTVFVYLFVLNQNKMEIQNFQYRTPTAMTLRNALQRGVIIAIIILFTTILNGCS